MNLFRRLRNRVAPPFETATATDPAPVDATASQALPQTGRGGMPTVGTVTQRSLAATPDYRITLHEHVPAGDRVVITFGLVGSGLAEKGFGTDFVLKNGWDAIHVAQAPDTQYQGLDLETFAATVSPALRDRPVFTYGQSIGGYCALYYGGSVDARIIALAPLNSAHPLIGAERFAHLTWKHQEIAAAPRASRPPVILFDPNFAPDKTFFDGLIRPAYPDAQVIELPFAGHTIALTMQLSRQLGPFVTSLIAQDILREVRLIEDGSYIWHAERGHALWRARDLPAAESEFRKSFAIQKEQRAVTGLLLVLMAQQRRADLLDLLGQMSAKETQYLVSDSMKRPVREFLGL